MLSTPSTSSRAGASPVPTPHPGKLALAFLPVAWSLPTTIVVKKLKPNSDNEFTNELRMYEKLKSLQGKQIPVCYGEAYCDGTRALVLEDVGGVSLYHRSALVEMSEEQIAQMILASYLPMIGLNLAYDDWKLDNFHLVDGRIVFLDLEYVYELDYDPEQAIQLGQAAILERWNQFREQYEEYGEIEIIESTNKVAPPLDIAASSTLHSSALAADRSTTKPTM
ncbi:hypothetical protein MY4824_008967 [Beauveria thailandica]